MKRLLVLGVLSATVGSVFAQDWPIIVQPPRKWRPPPAPHEPRPNLSGPGSPFTYRGAVYPSYGDFKTSPQYAAYQEENALAALRFEQYLRDKEMRRTAAVNYFRYRTQFPASTQVWMDENARWHNLARTAWAKLRFLEYEE